MLRRFIPRQESFFNYFQQSADVLHRAAEEFCVAMRDGARLQQAVDNIAEYEIKGDEITHKTFTVLHKTFITPFDRHDIHRLTSRLDDVLDLINRCAQRLPHYDLKILPDHLLRLADISLKSTALLREAIPRLKSLNCSDEIFEICQAVDSMEDEAHQCVITGERDLFLYEDDFKQFYKLKDLYARTKLIVDRCRDVAHIIKDITLEYS